MFFCINFAKLGEELFLRIAMKFESIIILLHPNLQLTKCFAIHKSKNFDFWGFCFNLTKLCEKMFLRIAIKFGPINIVPDPLWFFVSLILVFSLTFCCYCFLNFNLTKVGQNLFLRFAKNVFSINVIPPINPGLQEIKLSLKIKDTNNQRFGDVVRL